MYTEVKFQLSPKKDIIIISPMNPIIKITHLYLTNLNGTHSMSTLLRIIKLNKCPVPVPLRSG